MYDIIFCGGGLSAALTAWRLHSDSPELKLLILEQGRHLGGHHTWSFFKSDLTESQYQWITPLIQHTWPQYEVRFPELRRSFFSTYCSTDSEALDRHIQKTLPKEAIRTQATIARLTPDEVVLDDGETLKAKCLIDCRGPEPNAAVVVGFQKFTGRVIELKNEHGLAGPVIMDASVPQDDYRFVYTLPFSPTQVLVEDTRYANSERLNIEADRTAIADYVKNQGWKASEVVREEDGVLPIMLGGDIDAFWKTSPGIPRLGLRAALFHAVTGYSFPDAVRTADLLARNPAVLASSQQAYEFIRDYSRQNFRQQRFLHLLNRMLFMAAKPEERYVILERFHRLPTPLVERFYANRLQWADKIRILVGRPPVPIIEALRCLPEASLRRFSSSNSNQQD